MVVPKEIEHIPGQNSLVNRSHVVGNKDDEMGEIGCARVVPSNAGGRREFERIALCAENLARFKIPNREFCVKESNFPLT